MAAPEPLAELALLPTPLEDAGRLPSGRRLWIKRDDLTGLGMGGNKARKLAFLCADAVTQGCDALVTVGAAQSNHARMTAAAGARLGLDVHLVLGGEHSATGNQLLSELFGAHLHLPGTDDWGALSQHLQDLVDQLAASGRRPYLMPIGGSTPLGAFGFLRAWRELLDQLGPDADRVAAVAVATSSGGTHGGMLAGRAVWGGPPILAIDVAKQEGWDLGEVAASLAADALSLAGLGGSIDADAVQVVGGFTGPAYAVPTEAGQDAQAWAARAGGWVLDPVYTAKAFAGLLAWDQATDASGGAVFWHTGGQPAVFAAGH